MLANFSNLITFSRGSNATLTDASGRLTYAPHNLVTNSQDFEAAAWTKNNVSVTANSTVAPDGTATADLVVPNTTGGVAHSIYASVTVAAVPYILSVYAKSGGYSAVKVGNLFTGVGASFNLATGVVHSTDAGVTATITAVGNGWFRCSAAFTAAAGSTLYGAYVQSPVGTNAFAGDGTSGVYLWGAQIEAVTYQTTPSPYVSTSVANLLGFSEAFDNAAWTKQRASIVPNVAQNPINGLWNAQKLMEDTTASNTHRVFASVTTAAHPYTLSVYMKAGERNWAYLRLDRSGGTTAVAWFNLSTGVVGSVQTGLTASIQSVGNGWYRCTATIDAAVAGAGNPLIGVTTANATESYTGDGNSGIYIYGAQLSNSGSLDPYVPTPGAAPSSTAYYGPRYDYDPVTLAAKGILIEETRTNLATYSQDLTNAAWTKTNTAVSGDAVASPDGAVNADKLTSNNAVTGGYIASQNISVTSGTTYTASVYLKAAELGFALVFLSGSGFSTGAAISVNLSTGAVSTGTGTPLNVQSTNAGNGWWRVSFSLAAAATATGSLNVYLSIDGVFGTRAAAIAIGNGIYVYGAQLEAGTFATSYMPTVASQVTRSADVASITGSLFSQWYNGSEGAIVYEYQRPPVSGFGGRVFASGVGGSNSYGVWVNTATGTQDAVTIRDISGDAVSGVLFSVNSTAVNKGAVAYKVNDFAWSSNGGTAATDTSGVVPSLSDQLRLGRAINTDGSYLNGHIRNITYYPNRLPNDQLQAITK